MTKRHLLMLSTIGFLLFLAGLTGCFNKQEEMAIGDSIDKSESAEKELFLLKKTEDSINVDLYLKTPEQANTRIVSNVDYFHYLRKSKAFLLGEKTEDLKYSLYLQTADGNKYLLCNDAWPESLKVTEDEAVLYFLRARDESGSCELYRCPIAGYYENITGDLANEMEKVVSDIISFEQLPEGVVYVTSEDKLFIKRDGQESQLIATGVDPAISTVKERVFYKTQDNPDNYPELGGTLYFYEYNHNPQKIDSNVTDYQITDDGELVYYLNNQANLYSYSIRNKIKVMIDLWLNGFLIDNRGQMVIYKDMDENVYLKENGKKREKIGFGCRAWCSAAGKIVYLANNQDLAIFTYGNDQEKVASGVKYFVLDSSGNSLAYYSIYNELFFQELGQERIKMADSLTDFVQIYLGNNLLYQQSLPSKPRVQIMPGEEIIAEEEIEECHSCEEL